MKEGEGEKCERERESEGVRRMNRVERVTVEREMSRCCQQAEAAERSILPSGATRARFRDDGSHADLNGAAASVRASAVVVT